MEKINKAKRSTKIAKSVARLIKKIKRAQISNKKNKRGNIIVDPKRIIMKYYAQLYANKSDNLDKLNKFFENNHVLKWTQDETENVHFIPIKESKFLSNTFP